MGRKFRLFASRVSVITGIMILRSALVQSTSRGGSGKRLGREIRPGAERPNTGVAEIESNRVARLVRTKSEKNIAWMPEIVERAADRIMDCCLHG